MLGWCLHLAGQVKKSTFIVNETLEMGKLQAHVATQILALQLQIANYYAVGELSKCIKSLEDIKVILESIDSDVALADMTCNGFVALIQLRSGSYEKAWKTAELTLTSLNSSEPCIFFTFLSYTTIVEVYLSLTENQNALVALGQTKSKVLEKAEKALGLLKEFSNIFVFCQPRCAFFKGVINFLNSNKSKADGEWQKSLEQARDLKLTFEQAYILYHRGILTLQEQDKTEAKRLFPEIEKLFSDFKETTQNLKYTPKTQLKVT